MAAVVVAVVVQELNGIWSMEHYWQELLPGDSWDH
jgi:hypothetical protein